MYYGTVKEREAVLNDFKMGRLDVGQSDSSGSSLSRLQVTFPVLTSFDIARREIDFLDNLPWSAIVCCCLLSLLEVHINPKISL